MGVDGLAVDVYEFQLAAAGRPQEVGQLLPDVPCGHGLPRPGLAEEQDVGRALALQGGSYDACDVLDVLVPMQQLPWQIGRAQYVPVEKHGPFAEILLEYVLARAAPPLRRPPPFPLQTVEVSGRRKWSP